MSGGFGLPVLNLQSAFAGLGESYEAGRQKSALARLGSQLGTGDYAGAASTAFDAGDAATGVKLLSLGEEHRKTRLGEKASQDFAQGIGGFTPGGTSSVSSSAAAYKTDDPVADNLRPEQKALLNAIAGGESGGKYNVRFTPRGGALFDGFAQHPGIAEMGPDGPSTAAGRYQFTKSTWDELGGGDFSPANQDRRALVLAGRDYRARTGRDLDSDLSSQGFSPSIQRVLSPTWRALAGNAGQHSATYADSLARYRGAGGAPTRLASADAADLPAPGAQDAEFRIPGEPAAGPVAQMPLQSRIPFLLRAAAHPYLPDGQRQLAQTLLKSALDESKIPDEQKDYVLARSQGFGGTFLDYKQALKAESGPISLAPGNTLVDRKTNRPLYTAPDRENQKLQNVAPGHVLFDPATGKPVYAAPGDQGGFTLGEGQSRFDAGGRQIATVAPKPTRYTDVLSPEDRAAAGVPAGYEGTVQRGPDGAVHYPGKPATAVNIDQKGETAFAQTANTGVAKRFQAISEEGDSARVDTALLGQLRGLGDQVSTGGLAAIQGYLAEKGVKIGDVGPVEAYGALIDKLTPQQRVPGTGATSDFDARMFKGSLPRLVNTPDGNRLIIGTLEALAQDKIERARIADRALTGELKPADAIMQLRALPSPNLVLRSGLSELQKAGKLTPDAGGGRNGNAPPAGGLKPMPQGVVDEAKAALAGGRSRQGVIEKLQQMGLDPSGL